MTRDAPDGLGPTAGAMRAEWRAEEDEVTRAAYEQWRHGRTVTDLLAECAARGDAVRVRCDDETFRGEVTAIGPDCATLRVGSATVDLALGAPLVLGIERAAAGEGATPAAGTTLRARFLEHETTGVDVTVHAAGAHLTGTVTVGADHVVVRGPDAEHLVPLATVDWVRTGGPAPDAR